ncbi:MAG: hypothetical protein QXE79_07190 [Candidatus Bathyarchaeia archaeon]
MKITSHAHLFTKPSVPEARCNLQRKLELELERLKRKLCMGYELKVKWIP